MKGPTQKEVVLSMLKSAGQSGVRSDAFIANYMPRAAARIQELRDEGVEITSEREGKYVRYRLVGVDGGVPTPQGAERAAVSSNVATVDSGETVPGGVNETACSPAGEAPASLFEVAEEKPRPRSAFVDGEWGEAA